MSLSRPAKWRRSPESSGRVRRRPSWRSRASVGVSVALAVALAGLLSLIGVPSYAAPVQATIDPSTVRASMEYLVSTYHISDAEALRRLQLQLDSARLDAKLTAEQPDTYGGMWLDQDHGGVLNVAMTSPSAARPYLDRLADKHTTTVAVAHSLASLTASQNRIAQRVSAGADAIYLPQVDVVNNRVVLLERSWVRQAKLDGTWDAVSLRSKASQKALAGGKPAARANTSAAGGSGAADDSTSTSSDPAARLRQVSTEVGAADAAAATEDVPVVRQTMQQPHQLYTPYVDWGYCHPLYCSPGYGGMRGGLRLDVQRDDGSWGGCTSGFNVRTTGSTWGGWAWVLTAGHCVVGKTNQHHIQHNGYDVLLQHGVERNAYPYDYAALPFVDGNTATTWLESQVNHNLVMTYCRNGGWDSDASTPCGDQATSNNTPIRGIHSYDEVQRSGIGWVVCASGSASSTANYPDSWPSGNNDGYLVGTRCGVITGVDGGFQTDICARPGDSGGSLFSQIDNTAYGILEGSMESRSGACYAGEKNNYASISVILWDINSGYQSIQYNYNTTMNLILSSNG